MRPPPEVQTLAAYERIGGYVLRPTDKLRGAKRALFDGHVIHVSRAMADLYADKRDRKAWRRFLQSVDVVCVRDAHKEFYEAM